MNLLKSDSVNQKPENNLPPKAKNHAGKRFGLLIVNEYAGKDKYGKSLWRCLCDCGKEITTLANTLISNKAVSCGSCSKKARAKPYRKTALYRKYWSMIDRCQNQTSKVWDRYGGRGIKVCDRWRNSFDAFVEDMGVPKPKMTIERIDNNKGYSPENCKWATMQEQQRNRRDTVKLSFAGQTKCLAEWAKDLAVSPQAIAYRLKAGYSVDDALSKPFRK